MALLSSPYGVGGVGVGHHLEAGEVGIQRLDAGAVLAAQVLGGATGASEHDGDPVLPAGHLVDLRRAVDDLVEGHQAEVPGHELDDRPQAGHGRADAQAREAALADRGVDDALGSELVEQALADLVGAVVVGDLLPHQEDGGVALHLLAQGPTEGLSDLEPGHAHCSWGVAPRSVSAARLVFCGA